MSSLYEYNEVECKPRLGPVKNSKKGKNSSRRVIELNKPMLLKTEGYSSVSDNNRATIIKEGKMISLNNHGRWEILNKPWLLREDTPSEDFRVAMHVMSNRDKLVKRNDNVVSVYTCDENGEASIKTKKGSTSLANLTYSPKEKENSGNGKQKIADYEKKNNFNIFDWNCTHYDIFVAHSNPSMTKKRTGKGPKAQGKKRNYNFEDELEEYYDDLYEEEYDVHDTLPRTSQKTTTLSNSEKELNDSMIVKEIEAKPLNEKEIAEIRNAVDHSKTRRFFALCRHPCVEFNAGPFPNSYSNYDKLDIEGVKKNLLPLKNYQIHIAKREEAEVERMFAQVQKRIERMYQSFFSKTERYVKLSYSEDIIEIVQHSNCKTLFFVRIVSKENKPKKIQPMKVVVNNEDLSHFLSENLNLSFLEVVVQGEWRLKEFEKQIFPIVQFLKKEFFTSPYYPEENSEFVEVLSEEIAKAVEKTAQLVPLAVSIFASTDENFVDIVIKQNWRQPNQNIVYRRKITQFRKDYKNWFFAIQFIIPFEKL